MIHLTQRFNTKTDAIEYTQHGHDEPTFLVDSSAVLFKHGEQIGTFRLRNTHWDLYIGDKLYGCSPANYTFKLPEFELDILTILINEEPCDDETK